MKRIQPGLEQVTRILGEQKHNRNVEYRLSKYCCSVAVDEGTIYYHTLTGAIWFLEGDEKAEDFLDEWIGGWAFVPEGFDERKQTDDLRRLAKILWKTNKKTHFWILTTTDCNARCYYCYEKGIERFSMTEQTASDTAEDISKVCGGDPVGLTWFGGEPLYNRRAIEIICSRLRENGIHFQSSMISNGYYFDRKTSEMAVRDWKLEKIQITLDGTAEVYKRTKAYIERDEDPFSRVLNNIEFALQAGIEVYVRLNMNRKNAADLMDLAHLLAERFPDKSHLHVYPALLREFTGPVYGFEADEELEKVLKMRRQLWELGLFKPEKLSLKPRIYCCMGDDDSCEGIMPDGRIATCQHYDKAEYIGAVFTSGRDTTTAKKWKETGSFPSCNDCPLYPRCVSLKKCPWMKEGCSDAKRTIKLKDLEDSVLAAYREWKEKERTT